MSSALNWILVVFGFCLLVILHEAGHFFAAKATGMRVERFFLFLGPKVFSVKRGETEYGVAAIPLGGYVKITGMNPEEELPPEVAERGYYRQPVWKRIVVIGAGPAVNIVLAFMILFCLAFNASKIDSTVGKVEANTPAAAAHLQKGDRVVSVDGKTFSGLDAEDRLEHFSKLVSSHHCAGKETTKGCRATTPVRLEISRDGQAKEITVYPTYDPSLKRTRIGFSYGDTPLNLSPSGALDHASGQIWTVTSGTVHVFTHLFESKQRKQVSGIVGVGDVAHQVVGFSISAALGLLALVSLSLGLINLLPILPLDGGHIFWSLVEKLRGKPVSMRVIERATVLGFVLVAALMFIGLNNDIGRLTGEGFNVR
jgi:regulator of sigma E protease